MDFSSTKSIKKYMQYKLEPDALKSSPETFDCKFKRTRNPNTNELSDKLWFLYNPAKDDDGEGDALVNEMLLNGAKEPKCALHSTHPAPRRAPHALMTHLSCHGTGTTLC